jgi:hypothetical protein
MIDWQTIVVAIVSSNGITILLTWLVNRHRSTVEAAKIRAETDDTKVGTALRLVDELQEARLEDNQRFRDYRQATDEKIAGLMTELKVQEKAIDNLEAQNLKYQLVLSILLMQLRQGGLEPLIDPQKIDLIEVDDLKIIAQGLSNVETRRRQRQKERGND